MLRTYEYFSNLKPYIEGFVEQKRASGYNYEFEAYIYSKFDGYCLAHNLSVDDITKDALKEWMTIRDTEGKGYFSQRISFVRQLLIYINSLGIPTYIPHGFTAKEKNVPHIFSDEEIKEFFHQVDIYVPKACTPTCTVATPRPAFLRISDEYRVLFRLIYCCGLRNSEACDLTWDNVDLEKNIITIIHSKGDKDRLVYLHDDMVQRLNDHKIALFNNVGFECRWVFPGVDPENKFLKSTVDYKFNEFWRKTKSAGLCDKKPVVHSLRHTFVIKRMNLWMEQGINLNAMMPFLSKFLGHKSRSETFYYYHQVDEAFKITRQRDSKATTIIPEVIADE
ncbi:tyrosine-type recombinase/integrase [Enterococcus larvae]|uniref:tyrosine-type recombinase/integrase n=1 Tax=Enterococcus larvae TaxID=2794352 RepID=UPI003F2B0821